MKIAAFVTDFPLHLLCWLCDIIDGLAARGVQVDLYLYKAGEPPRFRPGVRVIRIPDGSGSAASLVPAEILNAVRKSAGENRYEACIGFESRALLLAKVAAESAGCPLVHHSFELYEPGYPGVWKEEYPEIKKAEKDLIPGVDLLLIQDADRQREYFRILGTDNRPLNTMLLPVSLPRLASSAKPRYWHRKYNLPPESRVVFYMGQLSAARFVDQMIIAAQSFRDDQRLVVHGPFYNNRPALQKLIDLDTKRRVIFSTEMLPWDQVAEISASADIGLVFYRSQYVNELTTGRSSDKLARYLQSGIPVICSDFPSFRREIERYRFGQCCSDYARMPERVNHICDHYAAYQHGAQTAFKEVYNLDPYLDQLVPTLQRLGQDKRRTSAPTSMSPSIIKPQTNPSAADSTLLAQVLGGDGNLFGYTRHVYLELSNLCNYAHLHKTCPAARLAENHDILPAGIVEDVLTTLGRFGYKGRIGFHTYNEPLMDPRLTQFTRQARQACPDSEIYICTNGYYLDQTIAEDLVESGVSHIHVSAYSDSEQRRLETIRVPIEYHVNRMTLDKRMDAYDNPETQDHRPCYSPLYQVVVTAAGRISLCCMDWKREHDFGDLHKQSFEQAMRDPAMWSLYQQLSTGDRRLSLCKRCQFVRGQAEPETPMNPSSRSNQPIAQAGRFPSQASTVPVATAPPSRPPAAVPFGPRLITRSTESDPNRILAAARQLYASGRYNEAFDLYEQLSIACPQNAVDILAELYDQYRRIPNSDRYVLYQSRCFDFGIRPGDKVLDIGSGNIPFHLATHLADLTLDDDALGRAGAPFKQLNGKPVYQCNIERMPFADKEFDFAYCSHVLEHVSDPAAACRELMRIAKRGYIETPSPAKDLWLDTIAVSNHRWAVETISGKLVFREYAPSQRLGLQSDILRDMHCGPQTPREKAFSALVYLKADRMNTMLLWDDKFAFEVHPVETKKVSGTFSPDAVPHCPLSIIVTVYQKEAQIGHVVAGILENTTSPFELVMVYDGCTDRSEPIVNSILAADKGLMQKLTVVRTPDVNEVRANNAGMRAAAGDYWILLQDDMQVTERGWEKRLLYPILQWPDVFAVSANKAHSFTCTPPPNHGVDYTCTVSAQREVFQIRDAVNRGPLAVRADAMRRLDFLDEAFAPIYFDDMDLCVRAYQQLKMVCGVYAIGYRNLQQTVGANQAAVLSTGGTWRQSADKNRRLFWQRYHDHFANRNHDEDRPCMFNEQTAAQSGKPNADSQQPTIPVVRGLPMSRLGTEYGGWTVDLDLIPIGSTIISAGVGEDISFDQELIARRNCTVIGIDPTEKAARFIQKQSDPRYHFLLRALAEKGRPSIRMYRNANPDHASDSVVPTHQSVASGQFYEAQTVCLDDLLRECPNVSLLKMDIEGSEYSVLASVARLDIPQICVEFHHFCTDYPIEETLACIERLGEMGYVLAHASGKAAPLQQVTFVHSRCLPKSPAKQSSDNQSMVGCA